MRCLGCISLQGKVGLTWDDGFMGRSRYQENITGRRI